MGFRRVPLTSLYFQHARLFISVKKLFPVHGLNPLLHHLVLASEHSAADVLLALLLPDQGEVQVTVPCHLSEASSALKLCLQQFIFRVLPFLPLSDLFQHQSRGTVVLDIVTIIVTVTVT